MNAEYNMFRRQQQEETLKQVKEELQRFMKQEDQYVSFNSSAPRFKDEASH